MKKALFRKLLELSVLLFFLSIPPSIYSAEPTSVTLEKLSKDLQKCIEDKLNFIKENDVNARLPRILGICSNLKGLSGPAPSSEQMRQKKTLEDELTTLAQVYLKGLSPEKMKQLQAIKDRYQEVQKRIFSIAGIHNQGQKHCIELIFI